MSANKKVHIIAGGTMFHIAPHLALTAPAYGKVGRQLIELCQEILTDLDVELHTTKMASGHGELETNADVAELIDKLKADAATKIIFMPVALCDFEVTKIDRPNNKMSMMGAVNIGKQRDRLRTSEGYHELTLRPAEKIIPTIRNGRKDIFLVGFKTTSGATEDEQYIAGLNLLKGSSCNLVLANDLKTRVNMIITPEEARYHVTRVRETALHHLVEMTKLRSHLTFTRSTVVAGESVPWTSDLVPATLRKVVDHCIAKNAYKPFRGATVGHFAAKLPSCSTCKGTGTRSRDARDAGLPPVSGYACRTCHGKQVFLTSKRKTNFNDLDKIGLVRIETDGPDTVLAYGAKPSVGGQSQRIVFSEHPEYDCIVHFHCPLKPCMGCHRKDWACACNRTLGRSTIQVVSQREYECGSHQCGANTSRGLRKFGNLSAVFLDQHGPNIVFHHSIDPQEVIDFIDANFDLAAKTGGYVELGAQL
jgi:hypothetical protein